VFSSGTARQHVCLVVLKNLSSLSVRIDLFTEVFCLAGRFLNAVHGMVLAGIRSGHRLRWRRYTRSSRHLMNRSDGFDGRFEIS